MNDPLCSRPEFTVRPNGYGEYKKNDEEFGFFVESDMGTERETTIRNRLARYYQFRQSGKFNGIFFTGDEFRVLFICRSRKRAKELHRMARIYPGFMFWFTDYETFLDRPLFDRYWLVSGCKDPEQLHYEWTKKPGQVSLMAASLLPLNSHLPYRRNPPDWAGQGSELNVTGLRGLAPSPCSPNT